MSCDAPLGDLFEPPTEKKTKKLTGFVKSALQAQEQENGLGQVVADDKIIERGTKTTGEILSAWFQLERSQEKDKNRKWWDNLFSERLSLPPVCCCYYIVYHFTDHTDKKWSKTQIVWQHLGDKPLVNLGSQGDPITVYYLRERPDKSTVKIEDVTHHGGNPPPMRTSEQYDMYHR